MKLIARKPGALRVLAALLMLMALGSIALAQDEKHLETDGTWSKGPVGTAEMNRRVAQAALDYREYAPIPRIGFYDVAYPANSQEYTNLAGHGLLLITAITQDNAELPLKRVYLNSAGKEIELQLIVSALSKKVDERSLATFGPYRMDALYLLPLQSRVEKIDLMIDFAVNRKAFRVGTISGRSRTQGADSAVKVSPNQPAEESLRRFIEREYPGFANMLKQPK